MSKKVDERRAQRAMAKAAASRACGTCTACCTALGVLEIEKAPETPCKHQIAGGCGIYARRPKTCREYSCFWRLGMMTAERRPDRFGVIFDALDHLELEGARVIFAREARPLAFDEPEVRRVMDRMAKTFVLVKLRGDTRTLIGPAELREVVEERLRRALPIVVEASGT